MMHCVQSKQVTNQSNYLTDARAHFYAPFGVVRWVRYLALPVGELAAEPTERDLPLPLGEVAEHSEGGEGKP